jgi:hypothetical protein
MKAIHLICHATKLSFQGLHRLPAEPAGVYLSRCWIIQEGNPFVLVGGWLYFHESSYQGAGFAARILKVQNCITDKIRPGFAFTIRRVQGPKGRRWRGNTPSQTCHHGGIVEADFVEEIQNANDLSI